MPNLRTYSARLKKRFLQGVYYLYDQVAETELYSEYTHFQAGFENANYRFGQDEICFIHLPKTAGTSFAKLLASDPENRFAQIRIHRPVSPHCPPSEYRYITVLRDPVDRVWSLYQMVLRDPKDLPYRKQAKRGLRDFLEANRAARNLICRYLSGEIKPEPSAVTLAKAERNLAFFYYIINFENFAEEATDFLQAHSVPFAKIPNERKSRYAKPGPEERAVIAEYNKWDILLFQNYQNSLGL